MIPGSSVPPDTSQGNGASNVPPVRHSRPLTAAELHLELEREQEAVVNRLTRELAALRTQNSATIVSNGSSMTDSGILEAETHKLTLNTSVQASEGLTHPVSNRRDRSSSSISRTSARSARSRSSTIASQPPVGSVLQSSTSPIGAERIAGHEISQPPTERAPQPTGAEMSPNEHDTVTYHGTGTATTSGSRAEGRNYSPSLAHIQSPPHHTQLQRPSFSSTTARIEEVAQARASLETARRENEALVTRLKELEQTLRRREAADA